ncbi:epithelial cell adhesion molecule isoform X1 [Python bivittatus]|uniref:Epithelial cell adhesion molecule n=1 Tax=Python bivittatus TaxID=176946 RepID=A0A9F2QWP0_PYTBI|nr:epithelial cell adhesion molecule isoform X1 [Python bivittatus]XP_007428535.1 epithelial cell adhesion molecule isoform X2 [Python bivittatus]XP_025022585.1 epithelial cell adhesion molecule isoform X1 [Python bivittatus]
MELSRRVAFLLVALLALAATVWNQEQCLCKKNKRTTDCFLNNNVCLCKSLGHNKTVNCSTLTSKCLLMKAEVTGLKSGRRLRPETAYVDNDGIYDPECDTNGNFKPKQCNGTNTCWCVNSAGVRRTEKGDQNITCQEVVRTSWIIIETKHLEGNTALSEDSIKGTIGNKFSERYSLDQKHINVTYEKPFIIVELKQNASDKKSNDVDIADVAYYFEKDVKGDPIFNDNFGIEVAGEPLQFENTVIYYVDEKPPEFSMKRLTAGVIAVIVVVVLAIVAGILVLIFTRRKRGKYEKAEVKEMNEMHRELNS